MNRNLLLIGAGGHCASVIDSLKSSSQFDKIGIIVKDNKETMSVSGIEVVGTDMDLSSLKNQYKYAFITIGSIGNTSVRRIIYTKLLEEGYVLPNIIDKTAVIADDADIGKGIYFGKNCIVNSRTIIHDCCIINTGVIIEHDCYIDDFAHIATGGILCGNVKIGKDTHIGAGAVVKQGISIGDNSMIGIGSIVVFDIRASVTAFGNPCREHII